MSHQEHIPTAILTFIARYKYNAIITHKRSNILLAPLHIIAKDEEHMLFSITQYLFYPLLIIIQSTDSAKFWFCKVITSSYMDAYRIAGLQIRDERRIILVRFWMSIYLLQFLLNVSKMIITLPISLKIAIPFPIQSLLVI